MSSMGMMVNQGLTPLPEHWANRGRQFRITQVAAKIAESRAPAHLICLKPATIAGKAVVFALRLRGAAVPQLAASRRQTTLAAFTTLLYGTVSFMGAHEGNQTFRARRSSRTAKTGV